MTRTEPGDGIREYWIGAVEGGADSLGMLFQEGGNPRGLNAYVGLVTGETVLIMNGWNQAEQNWGPSAVQPQQ